MEQVYSNFKIAFLSVLIGFMFLYGVQSFGQTIVYPSDGSDLELLAAKEARRYIYLRTDQNLPLQGVSSLPGTLKIENFYKMKL